MAYMYACVSVLLQDDEESVELPATYQRPRAWTMVNDQPYGHATLACAEEVGVCPRVSMTIELLCVCVCVCVSVCVCAQGLLTGCWMEASVRRCHYSSQP